MAAALLCWAACCVRGPTGEPLAAQVVRVPMPRPRPTATGGDTLTVTVSPASVSFLLTPGGVAQGSSAVSITTTWTGLSLFSSLTLSAYFASATQALTGGSPASSIPSLAVLGKMPTGLPTSFTPFTGSAPLGPVGSGLTLYSQVSLLSVGGSRTDALSLEINLASLPQLPAATYSGVLVLQAQAF